MIFLFAYSFSHTHSPEVRFFMYCHRMAPMCVVHYIGTGYRYSLNWDIIEKIMNYFLFALFDTEIISTAYHLQTRCDFKDWLS